MTTVSAIEWTDRTTKVSEMKERPILFSGEMVRATLNGLKTQTRRIIKPQPKLSDKITKITNMVPGFVDATGGEFRCPYGKVGDRLWVRETFVITGIGACFYRADGEIEVRDWVWRPSIFMPREYSRISLEITNVRAERLQDISEEDAQAEGVRLGFDWIDNLPVLPANFRAGFRLLWNSINTKRGYDWDSNPWVWVVEFRRGEQ